MMNFDHTMVESLRDVRVLVHTARVKYLERQEEFAQQFTGREKDQEDIIYDFEDSDSRLEALMICKHMDCMERSRIFYDLSVAEKDPELKHWAGVLYLQDHLIETARRFQENNKK